MNFFGWINFETNVLAVLYKNLSPNKANCNKPTVHNHLYSFHTDNLQ